MGPCYLLLASAMLTASPDAMPPEKSGTWHAAVAPGMRLIALEWQILDARELGRILVDPAAFAKDLKTLQEQLCKLQHAPLLEERGRFPSLKLVELLIANNRKYHTELHHRLEIDPLHAEELRDAMNEAEELFRAWDTLRVALTQHYYVDYQRQALDRLRAQLGLTAFYRGDMPPALPTWRFPRN